MGLIAGIFSEVENSNFHNKLQKMMEIQVHRDDGQRIIHMEENIAIGMSNRHNTIYSEKGLDHDSKCAYGNDKSGIYAFVDGIVLDGPIHKKYFEDIGLAVPILTCSAIIAAAYEKWGLDFMKYLDGEFSCVLWDKKIKKIILARDPYGHKPLHYYFKNEKLIFSSEIKGILATGISPEIDLISLSDLLSISRVPNPSTIFKDIYQITPGNMVVVSNNKLEKYTYWDHKIVVDNNLSFDDAVVQLTDSIRSAVKRRMLTEDTYCFLSGGVDSSAIVSFASEFSSKPIQAVCVGFGEEEKNEIECAKTMAKHVGAELHTVTARPESFFDMVDKILWHHDIPFYDTSAYPTYYAGKFARSFTDIILTGDGPDQMMGQGVQKIKNNVVEKYRFLQLLSKQSAKVIGQFIKNPSPSLISKIQRKLYNSSFPPALYLGSFFPVFVKKYMCTTDFWEVHAKSDPYRHLECLLKEIKELDNVNKVIFQDETFYIPDGLMIKVDRMCMANGLETLSPFQDKMVSTMVNKMPGSYKVHLTENNQIIRKYILKQICRKRFPPVIFKKKKQGFSIPLEKWIRQDNGKYIKEILLDERTYKRGYFKKESLNNFVDVFMNDKGDWYYPNLYGLVLLLTIELWHRKYLD